MAEYSEQFLEAIKHPRIQGTMIKRFDKVLFKEQIYTVVSMSKFDLIAIAIDKNEYDVYVSNCIRIRRNECLFIPEVYNSKNTLRSLIGMLGNQYTIVKYPFKRKTWYDITIDYKRKKDKFTNSATFTGTDFQLTLLEAVIFKKTGQTWNSRKKSWSEELYKL